MYDAQHTTSTSEPGGWDPPGRLPPFELVRYVKEGLTLVLLAIAFPWLLWNLLTRPGRVLSGTAGPTGVV